MLCWVKGFEESYEVKAKAFPNSEYESYTEWKFAKQEEAERRAQAAKKPRVNPDNPSYGYASDFRGNVLTNPLNSAKMEREEERITSSALFSVPEALTSSREFREKFNSMTADVALQRAFYQVAKSMLRHRSGTNGEDLYFYNTRTGVWTSSTSGTTPRQPEYTPEIYKAIEDAQTGDIVAFHNHPLSMPPSDSDLNAALENGYAIGYVICHNGRIFSYTAPIASIQSEIYKSRVAAYLGGADETDIEKMFEAQLKAIQELSGLYGFTITEVL